MAFSIGAAARAGAVAALFLSAPMAEATSILTGDVWQVTGTDDFSISWEGSTLEFTSQIASGGGDFAIQGVFDWVGSNGAYGTEYFSGTYFADDTFSFSGNSLVNPYGIILANYSGYVSADGNTIVGDWDDGVPGDFVATRVSAVPVPASLPLLVAGLLGFAVARRRA